MNFHKQEEQPNLPPRLVDSERHCGAKLATHVPKQLHDAQGGAAIQSRGGLQEEWKNIKYMIIKTVQRFEMIISFYTENQQHMSELFRQSYLIE